MGCVASEKQIASLKSNIQEQREKYTTLRNVSDAAARDAEAVLAGKKVFLSFANAMLETMHLKLVRRMWNGADSSFNCCAAERAKTEELEGVISEKELRTVDLSNKVAFYGQAYQKLQGKLTGMRSPSLP